MDEELEGEDSLSEELDKAHSGSIRAIGPCKDKCQVFRSDEGKEFRILLTTRNVPKAAMELLEDKCIIDYLPKNFDKRTLHRFAQGVDGILVHSDNLVLDAELLKVAGITLKVISLLSHDWIQVDMKEVRKRNIKIGSTHKCVTESAAEVAIGLGLTVARRVKEAHLALLEGDVDLNAPLWMVGYDYRESVIGILGLGRLGSAIAIRLEKFFPKQIIYYSRRTSPKENLVEMVQRVTFEHLIQTSDFLFICIPFSSKTKNMFNDHVFKQMKNRVVIICMSRLEVMNLNELYCALKKGYVWGAAMDVSRLELPPKRHPIHKLKNCVILPSVSGKGAITRTYTWMTATRNLLAGLKGEEMPFPVVLEDEKPPVETVEEMELRHMMEEAEMMKEREAEEMLRKAEEEVAGEEMATDEEVVIPGIEESGLLDEGEGEETPSKRKALKRHAEGEEESDAERMSGRSLGEEEEEEGGEKKKASKRAPDEEAEEDEMGQNKKARLEFDGEGNESPT